MTWQAKPHLQKQSRTQSRPELNMPVKPGGHLHLEWFNGWVLVIWRHLFINWQLVCMIYPLIYPFIFYTAYVIQGHSEQYMQRMIPKCELQLLNSQYVTPLPHWVKKKHNQRSQPGVMNAWCLKRLLFTGTALSITGFQYSENQIA